MEREEELDEEEWSIIENYNDYSISNYGRVKNTKTNKILKPRLNNCGRLCVTLFDDDGHKEVFIHKSVADAFFI